MKHNDPQDEEYGQPIEEEEDLRGFGHLLAKLFAACIGVVVIAITIKLVRWIIGF